MQMYEYKVIPAPKKAEKVRGLKTTQDRFAHLLTQLMNALGRDGWDYVRADALPCEERVGFTGKATSYQTMLVFRRQLPAAVPSAVTEAAQAMAASSGDPAPAVEAPKLGAAVTEAGAAPAIGPARQELAAE